MKQLTTGKQIRNQHKQKQLTGQKNMHSKNDYSLYVLKFSIFLFFDRMYTIILKNE